MNVIYTSSYQSPVGELLIGALDDQLVLCDWRYRKMRSSIDQRIIKATDAEYKDEHHPLIEETVRQLSSYFACELKQFDLPLNPIGTDFQKQVWQELLRISYGDTISYAQLSDRMNHKEAIRAIASANGANAISIIIPCHRVIGSNGDLVGYAGGLPAKKRLLKLEGASIMNQLELF